VFIDIVAGDNRFTFAWEKTYTSQSSEKKLYPPPKSTGKNMEVIWFVPIFGVIFGQNMGILPPGVPIYRVTPRCFDIYFEDIVSHLVLNVIF
jgi:hypothetical protein